MKHLILTLLLTVLSLSAYASEKEAYGKLVSKSFTIPQRYNAVNVSGGLKVVYSITSSSKATVEYEVSEELAKYIVVEVEGFTLNISFRKPEGKFSYNSSEIKTIYVSGPPFVGVDVSSASSFNGVGMLIVETLKVNASSSGKFSWQSNMNSIYNFRLNVSSAGTIEIGHIFNSGSIVRINASSGGNCSLNNVDVNYVDITASSAASVYLNGKAKDCDYDASSGALIDARTLTAATLNVHATSAAKIRCSAQKLEKRISSSGATIELNTK